MADWVNRLLAKQKLAPSTIAQYAIGLRYWDTWHQLRYGTPLPLAEAPPSAVSSDTVTAFIDDHLAITVEVEGRLRMRMVNEIDKGLREAGYNRNIDCVSPKTTFWRINVLSCAHRLVDLPFDRRATFRKEAEVNAIWDAERVAVGAPSSLLKYLPAA